ncbi:MAG: SDR family oxidoreductase [Planctomycetota bacterium]|jgi:nucleoside-diphosphate-sugar epimerase
MAKYLVTGGAGFIGSNLVRFLLDRGHEVSVIDNFSTGKRENLAGVAGRIELIEGDIRDRQAVDKAAGGCQAIFHQAALGSVPRSIADPDAAHDVNVNGTVTVLAAARAAGINRIIFASSSSIYGERAASPKHEAMAPTPISPYAASKVACEAYMHGYSKAYGLETLSLRYFNVFGPHQDPAGSYAAAIPSFISRLLRSQRPVVFGDGEQSRDFCYIDNVCEANWLAANASRDVCDGRPLNIACGRATTVNQILRQLRQLMDTDIEPQYTEPRPGDVRHSLADISLARDTIGYEPKIYFEDGLARAIDWYKENLS